MSVGVSALDLDHRQIVAIINLLEDAVQEGDGPMIAMLMRSLVQEVMGHFEREEKILTRYGYPDVAAHAAEHREMNAVMSRFADMLNDGRHELAGEALAEVKCLFSTRLLPDDMQYKKFFESRGIRPILTPDEEESGPVVI